jgi:hypothetical protein
MNAKTTKIKLKIIAIIRGNNFKMSRGRITETPSKGECPTSLT